MGRQRLAKNRGFPPNLYQNSAGYFYYVHPHSRKVKGMGRDRAAAFTEARAANAVLANMRPSSLADWVAGKTEYTLAEWLPIYAELWQAKNKPAANTLRGCRMYLRKLEACDFAWMKLRQITTAHIAKLVTDAEKESGAASAVMLRARTSDVFRWAETQGLIDQGANPVKATYVPDRTVKRERLTLEQFQAIRERAPTWLQRAMDLALLTGQRRGDIASMRFSDCKDGYLFVIQKKGGVRLQQDLRIRLEAAGMSIGEAVQACRDAVVSRYLIHHSRHQGAAKPGDKIAENSLTEGFQAAREAAGITAAEDRTPPSFHEIRSLSERLYRKEYGAEFAQAMLGHKHAQMTAKYDDLRGSGWQVVAAVNS